MHYFLKIYIDMLIILIVYFVYFINVIANDCYWKVKTFIIFNFIFELIRRHWFFILYLLIKRYLLIER